MNRLSVCLSVCLTALATDAAAQYPPTMGAWRPPFDHGGNVPVSAPGLNPPPPPFPIGNFLALHASLIPKGANRGKVLVWNHTHYDPVYNTDPPTAQIRVLRWSIVDPLSNPPSFQNFEIALPEGQGDLFCAGHAWNADGDLVVAGGTMWHGHLNFGWTGSKLMFIYRSNTNTWERGPDLDEERWYPSVINLGKDPNASTQAQNKIVVAGGSRGSGGTTGYVGINSYQVWVPGLPTGSWEAGPNPPPTPNTFAGPGGGYDYELWDYPRLHLLGNGKLVSAGFRPGAARINHYASPGVWANYAVPQAQDRVYNSSFLFPFVLGSPWWNVVVSTGGWDWHSNQIKNTVQISKAALDPDAPWPTGHNWTFACPTPPTQCPHGDMIHARWCHNSVVLPNATAMVFGGESLEAQNIWCSEGPVYHPELFVNGQWLEMAPTHIIRNYHSTALLLPNGEVLTAGGEYRKYMPVNDCSVQDPNPQPITPPSDYQVFQPPYRAMGGIKPVILDPLPPTQTLEVVHGGQYTVVYDYLPLGVSVTSVVLARCGSVTHHTDCNQRTIQVAFTPVEFVDPPALQITMPTSSNQLPAGYYMLFLVTNQDVPSEAGWVHVN